VKVYDEHGHPYPPPEPEKRERRRSEDKPAEAPEDTTTDLGELLAGEA
jgi:hypothetical protein